MLIKRITTGQCYKIMQLFLFSPAQNSANAHLEPGCAHKNNCIISVRQLLYI